MSSSGLGGKPEGLKQLLEERDTSKVEWFVLESPQGCGGGSKRV